jgi:glucose-6-phosphate isomerase, archaeal
VTYVTPYWAHRSINTGEEDLITFFVYPGNAGHDYATIDSVGFRKRLLQQNGIPTMVDNTNAQDKGSGVQWGRI